MKTKNAKHTPGPWTASTRDLDNEIGVIIGESYICLGAAGFGVNEADARLIAAAPELLESAKWVCRLFGTEDSQGKVELREEIFKLRAAIAKAEGR